MPADHPRASFRFFWSARVRYSEIDAQSLVFNAHYLTYFDTAIVEYYRMIGYDPFSEAKIRCEDWHVVRALVEFRAPMHYDLEFEIGVRLARLGRSSIGYALAIFPRAQPELLATGEIVHVYTDQRTRRSTPIPEDIRKLYLAFEAPSPG